jgi:hypothetical protein
MAKTNRKLDADQMARLQAAFERQRVQADQLVSKLREQREREADFIADTRGMRMVPVGDEQAEVLPAIPQAERLQPIKPRVALIGADESPASRWYRGDEERDIPGIGPVALNAHAHRQLGDAVGIPRSYYVKMLDEQPDLLAHNVNTWLHTNPAKRMVRTLVADPDSEGGLPIRFARGIMSNSYRRLDSLELTDAIMPLLTDERGGWQIEQCGLTDLAMHIEATLPRRMAEIAVGDEVALAVKIRTSDVAAGALTVALGVRRLICSNLMVVSDYSQRVIHLGGAQKELVEVLTERTIRAEDRLTMRKMRDLIAAMANTEKFEELVARIRGAAQTQVADPVAASELLSKNVGLSGAETHAVQGQLMAGDNGGPTIWGLANALTATARKMDFERKSELETAAGALISAHRSWRQYAEVVAA